MEVRREDASHGERERAEKTGGSGDVKGGEVEECLRGEGASRTKGE